MTQELITLAIQEVNTRVNDFARYFGHCIRIKWNGRYIIARGRGSWHSMKGARCAFHASYGDALSRAILLNKNVVSAGQRPLSKLTSLNERNYLIEQLIKVGALEFEEI